MKVKKKKRKKYRERLKQYKWCTICGSMFITTRRDTLFDSARCRQVAYRQRIEQRKAKRRKRRKLQTIGEE